MEDEKAEAAVSGKPEDEPDLPDLLSSTRSRPRPAVPAAPKDPPNASPKRTLKCRRINPRETFGSESSARKSQTECSDDPPNTFMTDDLEIFDEYLDALQEASNSDREGDAGPQQAPALDSDSEKVTYEDVEKLRDFSDELGTSYCKDYNNWRMGGARGAKGEAQDAAQEQHLGDGENPEAESELVINTLEDEWASLYMIPGLDDVLHKERTLEEKDDQGLAPLRSKVKRTRVVYEETPQNGTEDDNKEEIGTQEQSRNKSRKRDAKQDVQEQNGTSKKCDAAESNGEKTSLPGGATLSQYDRGYMAGFVAAQRAGRSPLAETSQFLPTPEAFFYQSTTGAKLAARDPINDLDSSGTLNAYLARDTHSRKDSGAESASQCRGDSGKPFIRNPPFPAAFPGALPSNPMFLNNMTNLRIGTDVRFGMALGAGSSGMPGNAASGTGVGLPFGTVVAGGALPLRRGEGDASLFKQPIDMAFSVGDKAFSTVVNSRRPAGKTCRHQGCDKKAVSSRLCVRHGGGRRCSREGCMNIAASRSTVCKTHGGGRRCCFEGCDKSAAVPTDYCKRHGGGKRCQAPGCTKSAQGSTEFCKSHGGGKRCLFEGCLKSAADSTEFCKRHGGGVRCTHPGCDRAGADGRTLCKRHGGGRRCGVDGCDKSSQGNTGLCRKHFVSMLGAKPHPS